jgi:DNA-binding NarL/FixJ family response regulator
MERAPRLGRLPKRVADVGHAVRGNVSVVSTAAGRQSHPHAGPLSVVIIEDLRDVREGLRVLVDGTAGFRCANAYPTMEAALAAIDRDRPDVILTDLGLPGLSGIDGIRILHGRSPDIPIVALTVHDDDAKVFEALCAGASGYLLKNTAPARLLAALEEVARGGAPMSPEVARRVVRLFREFRPPEQAPYHLTPQENHLLKLLTDGHHKKTAASEMGISVNTISFHLKNIYAKLQVHSKTEAVAKALRERLI